MRAILRRSTTYPGRYQQFRYRGVCEDVKIQNSLVDNFGRSLASHLSPGVPLTWYSCGPTVYDSSHLGHARTYICTDIIRRILSSYYNVPLTYAMGITDVDDKIIKKAVALQHENWSQALRMVRGLENDFFRDMDKLNVLRPDHVLRVTEHMSNIIAYTEHLVRNGNAYVTTDGVYFDFSSLVNVYDKFGCSDIPADEPEEGRGILAAEGGVSTTYATSAVKHRKRNARDFALWKLQDASAPFTWDSPWGPGRPGWHIECSAMTHSLFGTRLDIHSGGVDLKFPHHTNEIAQCEAHNCSEHNGWVKTWIHLGHLHIEGRKMSKSLKNFISIDDYLRAQITSAPADDFRMYCLRHKYHATLSYSTTQVQDAARLRAKFESFFASAVVVLKSGGRGSSAAAVERSRRSTPESSRLTEHLIRAQQEVHTALGEDFNTPVVLNALSALAGEAVLYLALVLTPRAERGPDGAQVFQQPLEPLFSSAAYVGRILTMLGLRFPAAFQLDAGSAVALEGEGGDGVSAEKEGAGLNDGAVDAIVQFRATVREAALQGVKALRVKKKSGESLTATELELQEQLQGILSASDASREKLGKTLGIKIEDLAALSKWTRI